MAERNHLEVLHHIANGACQDADWTWLREGLRPRVAAILRRRIGIDQDCEDVLQVVCCHIADDAPAFRGSSIGEATNWALRVATNATNKWANREIRRRQREGKAIDTDPVLETTDAAPLLDESLLRAFEALPDQHRVPLTLRYYEGLDNDAVAQHLGCSYKTAAQRIRRALQSLRRRVLPLCPGLGLALLDRRLLAACETPRVTALGLSSPVPPALAAGKLPWVLGLGIVAITTLGGLTLLTLMATSPNSDFGQPQGLAHSSENRPLEQGNLPIDLRRWHAVGKWDQEVHRASVRPAGRRAPSLTSPEWIDLQAHSLRFAVTIQGQVQDGGVGIKIGISGRSAALSNPAYVTFSIGGPDAAAFRIRNMQPDEGVPDRTSTAGMHSYRFMVECDHSHIEIRNAAGQLLIANAYGSIDSRLAGIPFESAKIVFQVDGAPDAEAVNGFIFDEVSCYHVPRPQP